jgi:hypothetical protein
MPAIWRDSGDALLALLYAVIFRMLRADQIADIKLSWETRRRRSCFRPKELPGRLGSGRWRSILHCWQLADEVQQDLSARDIKSSDVTAMLQYRIWVSTIDCSASDPRPFPEFNNPGLVTLAPAFQRSKRYPKSFHSCW